MSMDILEMVERAKTGDADAIRTLYDEYHQNLYFFCLMITESRGDADDIFQYCFYQAFHRLSALKKPENFKNWLYVIAANRSRTLPHLQKEMPSGKTPKLRLAPHSAAETSCPEAENVEVRGAILQLTEQLAFPVKLSVMLYYYCGISLTQIVKIMESDENTVRQYICAGTAALNEGARKLTAQFPELKRFDASTMAGAFYLRAAQAVSVDEAVSEGIVATSVTLALSANVVSENQLSDDMQPDAPAPSAAPAEPLYRPVPQREEEFRPAPERAPERDNPPARENAPMSAEARAAIRNSVTVAVVLLLAAAIIAGSVMIIRRAGKNPPDTKGSEDQSSASDVSRDTDTPVSDEATTPGESESESGSESESESESESGADSVDSRPVVTDSDTTEPPAGETETTVTEPEPTSSMYFTCKEITGGSLLIDSYTGSAKEVILPAEIDGKKVVAISGKAFEGNTALTSVRIPEGIVTIGQAAFRNCTSLKNLTLPSTLRTLETYAFYGCSSLSNVTIPSGVTSIGLSVFGQTPYMSGQNVSFVTAGDGILISCLSGSAEVTVPDTVKKITNAFYYKNSTVSIVLPSSVTEIGTYAFTGCPKLQSITIPSSVTSIAKDAIYDCKSLSAVYVKEGSYAESWLKDNGFESLIQYS